MQSHYNFTYNKATNSYSFITKNKIIYNLAFVTDETFSTIANKQIKNIYQIVIEKITPKVEPFDNKVSHTIKYITEQFFAKVENCLIYVCYDLDNKARIRYEVFDRWFVNTNPKHKIIKLNKIISIQTSKTEIQKLYTAFLFHKDNPDFNILIDIFNKIELVLNNDK